MNKYTTERAQNQTKAKNKPRQQTGCRFCEKLKSFCRGSMGGECELFEHKIKPNELKRVALHYHSGSFVR